MIEKITNYIMKYKMIEKNDKIVVGISGGADSVCLLYILKEIQKVLPITIIAVHVEHGIRGRASLEDAEFVKGICERENIPFELYSVDIKKESKNRKCSLEEAGRRFRYEAFQQTVQKYQAQKIAVAHNLNDRGETMLFHLFRGTGLKGLVGIAPVRENIIRPLLCVSRSEIEKYISDKNLTFRTDHTNFENTYTRNKIRNNIIPYVEKEIQAKAMEHISDTCQMIEEVEEYMHNQALKAFDECITRRDENTFEINLEAFLLLENIMKTYIIRLCIGYLAEQLKDITSTHSKDVRDLSTKEVGKKLQLPYQIIAERGYQTITIRKEKIEDEVEDEKGEKTIIRIEKPGTYRINSEESLIISMEENFIGRVIEEKKYTKWLDYGKINGDLLLRHREPGDFLYINGNKGKQLLKSYFINEKIPRGERDKIALLALGKHILWIVGFRISEEYKVTRETKAILKVQYTGGNNNE